jgi:hypothetical protein
LAIPPFAPSWEGFEDVWQMSEATKALQSSLEQATLEQVAPSCGENYEQAKSTAVQV